MPRIPTSSHHFYLFILTFLAAISGVPSCGGKVAHPPSSVADYLRSDSRFSHMSDFLSKTSLWPALQAPEGRTVFAPTNAAFDALMSAPDFASVDWSESTVLEKLLSYHIHRGVLSEKQLRAVTAIRTLDDAEIHVRLTLNGLTLNDGVRIDGEIIEASDGIIFVLDKVLTRPISTTTTALESTPNLEMPPSEAGYHVSSDTLSVSSSDYIYDLQVFVEIEHPDVSKLSISLAHDSAGGKYAPLLARPASKLNNVVLTFADSATSDIVQDVVTQGDDTAEAFPEASYRSLFPLERFVGESIAGHWSLLISDRRSDAGPSGRLIRWGLIATTGSSSPAPTIVFTRRNTVNKTFAQGFTEAINVEVTRVGGLSGPMELTGNAGSLQGQKRTLQEDLRTSGSLLFTVANDAPLGLRDSTVSARVGDVSRVFHFETNVVKPDAQGIKLLAHVPLAHLGSEGGEGNDVWGWTDSQTGAEIALVGTIDGTAFVDVSTPESPRLLGTLPSATRSSIWRDIKVYGDYAFIVSEAAGHGLQVFDLRELRNVTEPQSFATTTRVPSFGNAHNIAINETSGMAYVVGSDYEGCSGGILMFDISFPVLPVQKGCFSGGVPGGEVPGDQYPTNVYTHDVQCVTYAGPDTEHQGQEICLSSDEHTLGIADLSDTNHPRQLSRVTYPDVGYTHQGWLTEDQQYFILNDEFDETNNNFNTRSYVWDVRNLDAPLLLGSIDNPRDAIGHNTYTNGDVAYQANYTSGLRLMDISNIASATGSEIAYYDTYPDDDLTDGRATRSRCHPSEFGSCGTASYQGAWSNYPYFSSGTILVSDIDRGLFVLRRAP